MNRTPGMNEINAARAALLTQCPEPLSPADSGNLPIHVTSWGGPGSRVLLIHGGVQGGLGGGPASFAHQKPLSAGGWQLEMLDRPGFGSSPSRGPDDMEADAAFIAEKLGDSAHLIGHSFGGAEALLAAARRPEAVRSLILVEPALHPLLLTEPQSLEDPRVSSGVQMLGRLILGATSPADFALSFAGTLGPSNPSEAALREHPQRAAALGCALLRARPASPASMRAAADLIADRNLPVLVISGGYSDRQDATGMALARLLQGRHLIVPAANHFIQQVSPEPFNRAVAAFMREADAAGTRR